MGSGGKAGQCLGSVHTSFDCCPLYPESLTKAVIPITLESDFAAMPCRVTVVTVSPFPAALLSS